VVLSGNCNSCLAPSPELAPKTWGLSGLMPMGNSTHPKQPSAVFWTECPLPWPPGAAGNRWRGRSRGLAR
jgi:hypothetical protein